MIKSAIFGVKQFGMRKTYVLTVIINLLVFNNIYSQYTESINTYRPGTSQGAFSVGKNVVQAEAGLGYSRETHSIFDNKTLGFEFQYMFRAGLIKEQLEFSIQGSYLYENVTETVGNTDGPFTNSGFTTNTIGAKYLIYDPYKYGIVNKVNIRSWNANKKFNFKKLIPAVSAYLGLNITSTKNDFAFHNNSDNRATELQDGLSPKLIISAQNNWTENLVFVANFVYDDITTEFPDLRFILTSTYNFKGRWAILGEYEAINSKIYKDHIFRAGGTYLINNDFQLDASVSTNLKGTPYRFVANAGVSYRFDFHKPQDDERIRTGEMKEIEDDIEQIKKDIEDGLLDPSVMTGKYKGVDLEKYLDEEENLEEFDSIPQPSTPKKKRWWQKIGSKRKLRKKAAEKANDTTSTSVSTTRVLGTGGRISDFADDEFLKSKKEDITPKERTEEEQAILDAKIAERNKKKRKKNEEPLIDPLTNEPYTEEDLSTMTKKEIKRARKEQTELKELDDELNNLLNEVETGQSARKKEKERKKKEKAARKKAKAAGKPYVKEPAAIEKPEIETKIENDTKIKEDSTVPSTIDDIDKELEKLKSEAPKESKAEAKQRIKEEKKAAKAAKKKAKEEAKKEKETIEKEEDSSDW